MRFTSRMLLLVISNIGCIAGFYVFMFSLNSNILSTRLMNLDPSNSVHVKAFVALIAMILIMFCINIFLFSFKKSSSNLYNNRVVFDKFLLTRYFF